MAASHNAQQGQPPNLAYASSGDDARPGGAEVADLGAWLQGLGAVVRRRKDGSLHTVDFSAAPHAATHAALARLAQAERLAVLRLPGAPIADAAAESLARLQALTELDLRQTGITDGALAQLKPLAKLKILQLTGAAVTREGVKALRQSLLNCRIVHLD